MKIRQYITVSALCLIVLAGQVEYRALYCRMMKQTISESMVKGCKRVHNHTLHKGMAELSSSSGMLSVISKASVDKFEKSDAQPFFLSLMFLSGEIFYPGTAVQFTQRAPAIEGSPPDILILNQDLRI